MKTFTTIILCAVLQNLGFGAPARPNIVLIFTDDQRHDAVGYAGNPVIRTPNLDKLAKAGTIFMTKGRAFNQIFVVTIPSGPGSSFA